MTIPLYPEFVMANDLAPEAFGSEVDEVCEEIEKATKGFGANKQRVIDALATKDTTMRAKISIRYMELYGADHKKFKNMSDLMKHEFSGDLERALRFLSLPPHQAECEMLRLAMKGLGCNVDVIWSIVAGRTNEEMEFLKRTYFEMNNKDLGKALASELHGNMERLVFNCLQADEQVFDSEFHTPEKARDDAEALYHAGQGRWGTNEKEIFKVLCRAPPEHLENINSVYQTKYGYSLLKMLEKELGGTGESSLRHASVYLVGMKLNPHLAMARLIHQSCKGFGTNELLLTSTLIRFQPHMGNVYAAYVEEYGKTIHDVIRSEVSGKFKTLLLTVVNAVWPEQV